MDEIENHFNKEIVTTLVRFFMDSRLNRNGGTLILQRTIQNCWMNMTEMMESTSLETVTESQLII